MNMNMNKAVLTISNIKPLY